RQGEQVAELTALAAEHPLRERLRQLLMLALYRSGRQADALTAYTQARAHLMEHLGIEPSPELQRLHKQILTRDPDLQTPITASAGPPVPRQLPADIAGFTGRSAELAELDRMLTAPGADSAQAAAPVVISAVSGTPGVGKTALAIHWAHRVADQFPDGQLYVNLRGFDPSGQVMAPAEAVRRGLDALAVPPERIPVDLDA